MVGAVFFGVAAMFALVTSPQLLDVAWCSAVVVVVVVVVCCSEVVAVMSCNYCSVVVVVFVVWCNSCSIL